MNPNIARRIAYHKVFTHEETQEFLRTAGDDWTLGMIDDHDVQAAIRNVYVQEVDLKGGFSEKLLAYVWAANQALWKFELTGLNSADPPQLLRYEQGAHYDWHIDHDAQSCSRKLTCIVQLSDEAAYEGGDLHVFPPLTQSSPLDWRECGTLIIFPVYVPHRVIKVEMGTRDSLVFWVHGPAFC